MKLNAQQRRDLLALVDDLQRSLDHQGPSATWDFPQSEMARRVRQVLILRSLIAPPTGVTKMEPDLNTGETNGR